MHNVRYLRWRFCQRLRSCTSHSCATAFKLQNNTRRFRLLLNLIIDPFEPHSYFSDLPAFGVGSSAEQCCITRNLLRTNWSLTSVQLRKLWLCRNQKLELIELTWNCKVVVSKPTTLSCSWRVIYGLHSMELFGVNIQSFLRWAFGAELEKYKVSILKLLMLKVAPVRDAPRG